METTLFEKGEETGYYFHYRLNLPEFVDRRKFVYLKSRVSEKYKEKYH
jgi:hypothetical protein